MPNSSDPTSSDFFNTPLDRLLQKTSASDQTAKALALFQRCATEVPAYQQFLAEHQINPADISSYQDFCKLPMMNKADYMQVYALPDRCLGGTLDLADRVAVSSGSTGTPTFWPRSADFELDVAVRFEQVFLDSFQVNRKNTLAVVCFALGNWVGGMFTTSCCWHLARKGYPLLVATPGNQKAEILRVIRELAAHFEQTVLLGYPPFIKDVVDAGIAEGIDWEDFSTKLVFAGEVFSEEWRKQLCQRIGSANPEFTTASLYGTADGGVLGNETPFSIAIRRWLAVHPEAAHSLFGESRLPTLVQYDPDSRYFEVHEGTLLFSGENSLPLVRYHIADKGGLIEYTKMWEFLNSQDVHLISDLGLPEEYLPRTLPFVYVFGRSDFTVSYYGANIYPENISVGLEQPDIGQWLTGKFVLETQETGAGDRFLHVIVELLPDIKATEVDISLIAVSIQRELLRLNSEFANYTPPERQLPTITLQAFAHPEYFPQGVKHRYTRKN